MPLPTGIEPYSLGGVISGDNSLTHYKAMSEQGDAYVVTEFNPAYMVTRDDAGVLEVSERFQKEFANDLGSFINRAEAIQLIQDSSIHPIVDILERNNTAYLVRRACNMVTVDSYMGGQQMDYIEAYHFIRPVLLSMAQVADAGVAFNIQFQDFRVSASKQLVLSAPLTWDSDFRPQLTELARLFYKLVTGVEASEQGAPGFAVYGLEIPQRVESLIMDILSGDITYGSLDDFYKTFRSLLEAGTDIDPNAGKQTVKILQAVAGVLLVVLILAVGFMVTRWVNAYQYSFFWTNPRIFASAELPPPPTNDFSELAFTHPRDVSDPLGGIFSYFNGFVFFRNQEGMIRRRVAEIFAIPGATGVLATVEDTIIIEGVRPSFIVGHGEFIYFVDTSNGSYIYRSYVNGDELERITDFAALNLAVLGNGLFYTRPDTGNHLFRMNLNTYLHELILPMPVFKTLPAVLLNNVGERNVERLFVMAGEPNTANSGLYMLDLGGPSAAGFVEPSIEGFVGGVGFGLQIFNEMLYYLDMNGRINVMTAYGRHIRTLPIENVRNFDVFFQWVVFTENGRHIPRAYDMDFNEFHTISSVHWLNYVWINEGFIYGLDHRTPNLVHVLSLPVLDAD